MMAVSDRIIRVSIAQAAPVFGDKRASVEKALTWIQKAAEEQASVVAFGESWIAGYPVWLDVCPSAAMWNNSAVKSVYAELRQNSVAVPGPKVEQLIHAAKEFNITVCIGMNERVDQGAGQGTLYNTLLTVSSDGAVHQHRKLVPTFSERMVWGESETASLCSVLTNGFRLGGLICWEHWMPLARMAMHCSGEHIHVAAWPTVHDNHQLASRHYALEGRCFVLAAGSIMPASALPEQLRGGTNLPSDAWVMRGGSCIIAPDGRFVIEPIFEEEKLLVADINLAEIDQEVMTLDVTGHYARPDLFTFEVKS